MPLHVKAAQCFFKIIHSVFSLFAPQSDFLFLLTKQVQAPFKSIFQELNFTLPLLLHTLVQLFLYNKASI